MIEYEICGAKLGQMDTIMHWLGKRFCLVPKKDENFYKMLWWCNTVKDIIEGCMKSYLPIPEDKKKEILKAFYEKQLPVLLQGMEERLKSNKSQEYLVGRRNTVADFYLIGAWRGFMNSGEFNEVKDQASKFPTLLKYIEKKDKEL
jgi:glutathione S-transferase